MLLKNRYPLWTRLVLALGAMSLFILAYQWGNQYQRRSAELPTIQGILIQPPASLPDFALRDTYGRTLQASVLAQGWTLLAFGDLAGASGQLAAQRLIDTHHRVADKGALRGAVRLVLIQTLDRPDLARDFTNLLPALSILGGSTEQVSALREAVGLGRLENAGLFVLGPGGHLVAFLPESQSSTAIAEDLATLHAHSFLLFPES